CPEHLRAAMGIEIEVDKARAQDFIVQKTFGPVAEREDFQSVATRCHRFSEVIHLCVSEAMPKMVFGPAIQYAGAVNAQQHTSARRCWCVINVRKGVNARRVVIHQLITYRIDDTGSASRGSNFAGLQYV